MSTPSNPPASRESSPSMLRGLIAAIVIGLMALIYVSLRPPKDELSTIYGQRRGSGASDSVNGTAVLSAMFEKAGHRVVSATELSRRMDKYDTIVWAPDDFGPPSTEARDFLDDWLASGTGRTLVYIGRDYDAAPEYWERMLNLVEDPRYDEYQRRLAHAQSEYDFRRVKMPEQEDCDWFTMESDHVARIIPDLDGPWAEGVDTSKTEIVLLGRLDIPAPDDSGNATTRGSSGVGSTLDQYGEEIHDSYESGEPEIEILLQSENDVLAHRYRQTYWNSSQVIVVANGSFLLNMPLVNKEHRKLAGKLIAECGEPGNVAFLESGPNGVTVHNKDLANSGMYAHRILTIWPISFIVLHFAALGITYCIARFPIFGRPHRLQAEGRSDFGQHVAALGELLHKTKDTFFAQSRIKQYQTQAKRGSGQSHRSIAAAPLEATLSDTVQTAIPATTSQTSAAPGETKSSL